MGSQFTLGPSITLWASAKADPLEKSYCLLSLLLNLRLTTALDHYLSLRLALSPLNLFPLSI